MAPPKDKDGKAPREEFGAPEHNRKSGRKLRKTLLHQSGELGDSHIDAAAHGEDPPADNPGATPPEDRAG